MSAKPTTKSSAGGSTKPPAITIRVMPLGGKTIHGHAPHAHDEGGHDYIAAGARELGALSYSLLRAEALKMHAHRAQNVAAIGRRFQEFEEFADRVRAIDESEAAKITRQRPKLLMWDLIKEVAEACEALAALYTAAFEWQRSKTPISTSLLGWTTPAHLVFESAGFQDLDWWKRLAGIEPRRERLAAIASRQRRIVEALLATAKVRLPIAIQVVSTGYTRDLHRVAIRRRHLAPLLDTDHGLAFETKKPDDAEWMRLAVADGALVLADQGSRPGQVSQIAIPTDGSNVEALHGLWSHSNWLCSVVTAGILGAVESPTGVVLTSDRESRLAWDSTAQRDAIDAYIGMPRDMSERQRRTEARTHEVQAMADAAPSGSVPGNRQERRAEKRTRKRRRRR